MLDTLKQQLIVGGLGIALVSSIGFNVSQTLDKRDLKTQVSTLDKQINDPETGFAIRLANCRQNVSNLRTGINEQNASIAANAARGATAVAEAAQAVAEAQNKTAKAQRQAADILSRPPSGSTVCEQVEDIDRRIMGSLK